MWANNRLRVNYLLGVGGYENIGYSFNVTGDAEVPDYFSIWDPKLSDEVTKKSKYQFKKEITFNNYFAWEFKESLMDGLKLRSLVYSVGRATETTLY